MLTVRTEWPFIIVKGSYISADIRCNGAMRAHHHTGGYASMLVILTEVQRVECIDVY